ncbi:MAG: MocR-like pyridoxine biosynthesis transcription factor PdxR [Chloroflexota bacterium]
MLAEQLLVTLRPGFPYHRQVYEQLRAGILQGRLRPGDRLPSTRDLASRLGLARNTVARAYEDLLAEGFLSGRVGSGTYVAAQLAERPPTTADPVPVAGPPTTPTRGLSEWGRRLPTDVQLRPAPAAPPFDFRFGTPDWRAFPRALWLRLLGRVSRRETVELTRYGEPAGYYPLRQAIAQHLALSRGIAAGPEQVVIVSGSQQAVDLLTRLRVGKGDSVALEEPGYPEARRAFAAAGARLLGVPVDDDGLDVEALCQMAAGQDPKLIYVSPTHQFPTGVTLSLSRRLALLEWAGRRDVLVIEDDYDSEFRYTGRPVESLQGLDRWGRVVYVGTFSTVLFPPLRVGYVVLPPDLVEAYVRAKWLADRQTATLEQLALAEFLVEGHYGRHLRHTRRLAAERRAALLAAVAANLGNLAEPPVANTGMHVMLRLAGAPRATEAAAVEKAIVARAAEQGVGVYPSAPCFATTPATPALLLGYAALAPAQIHEGIARLAIVVESVLAAG